MIRAATERDIPAMLEIYRPYVENTTISFEYDLPCRKSFTQRFFEHTVQFPWLVWEENGKVLGYWNREKAGLSVRATRTPLSTFTAMSPREPLTVTYGRPWRTSRNSSARL